MADAGPIGARFGISSRDYAKVVAWLASEGLTIDEPGRARNWVAFSGRAAQVSHALHTPMRRYVRDGESHFANANPPAVPEALAGIVGGFLGLDDFPLYSHARVVPPDYNRGGGHYLVPQDFATIYNLTPLYTNLDGSGQKIVVVGQSEVSRTDLRSFRTTYGLPANDPIFVPYSGTSPGFTSSELKATWTSNGRAPWRRMKQIVYVYGTNALTAIAAAVNMNAGQIVSISYGGCEGDYRLSFYRAITQQGNAQGMTSINASGDSGAAGCDFQGSEVLAARGMSVSFPAALPEVTGVGGTQFADTSGVYGLRPIPPNWAPPFPISRRVTWNESSRTAGLLASGGGARIYYSRPAGRTGREFPTMPPVMCPTSPWRLPRGMTLTLFSITEPRSPFTARPLRHPLLPPSSRCLNQSLRRERKPNRNQGLATSIHSCTGWLRHRPGFFTT